MAADFLVEPDLEFIKKIGEYGGDCVKKCAQCATCSVVCTVSPDAKPFPRKEMIAGSWGLKDRLVADGDIWLCHNCGDCSTLCPRGARPGDVLSAIRMSAILHYSGFQKLGELINNPQKLPVLAAIPFFGFFIIGLILKIFGVHWLNFSPGRNADGQIAHHLFFSTGLVDLIFVPLTIWVVAVFALGLKRFIADMHENALREGNTTRQHIEAAGFIKTLIHVIPKILRHEQFAKCDENGNQATPHMMVFFSFVCLAFVTGFFLIVLYGFGQQGPYPLFWGITAPVKWLANISGIALVIGALLMLKTRASKKNAQATTYPDLFLIGLVLGLGATGMLTELTRLADAAFLTYAFYYIHLMFVFVLFLSLPFSKLAHLVYRTVALTYNEYTSRR